jgi:hypothetical protein
MIIIVYELTSTKMATLENCEVQSDTFGSTVLCREANSNDAHRYAELRALFNDAPSR